MTELCNLPSWALNVLEVYNYKTSGPYSYWYDYIQNGMENVPGDLVEVGVFRGRTFATTTYLCSKLSVPRYVYGFDTFGGFPDTENILDQPEQFERLLAEGSISEEHYNLVCLNKELLTSKDVQFSVSSSSSSGNFSGTSVELVQNKLKFLGLSNYRLVAGDTEVTMNDSQLPKNIAGIFLDADLYAPYKATLSACWDKLSVGGVVFLDEYFSLKFPGPRIATNEFVAEKSDAKLICIARPFNDFERWILIKQSK